MSWGNDRHHVSRSRRRSKSSEPNEVAISLSGRSVENGSLDEVNIRTADEDGEENQQRIRLEMLLSKSSGEQVNIDVFIYLFKIFEFKDGFNRFS